MVNDGGGHDGPRAAAAAPLASFFPFRLSHRLKAVSCFYPSAGTISAVIRTLLQSVSKLKLDQ